ncbi:ABC transporter permease [Ensifer sp. BR816]|uniref:ABC transporter permease n=1 Tax=Rhizobium sp. (strain BR816) TaxID=1057002 RepID=UPI00036E70B4|nr:ABC transporter permease [Ensifer sp. BR816]
MTFVLHRGVRAILTLWIVVTVAFLATRLSGDPTYHILPPDTPEAQRQVLRQQLGLDRPVIAQYGDYLAGLARGDFGQSFLSGRPVTEMYLERLPATINLTLPALLFSVLIGLPLGTLAAVKLNSPIDRGLMAMSFIGQAVPNFVVGIVLILVFSLSLRLLPSGGTGSWAHYVMPVLTLGIASIASISRLTRSSLLDVLGQDYIRFVRAKGLPPTKVIVKHALRNAMLPVLTVIGLQIGTLIGGAVVVEVVFAWPGAGRLLVSAVMQRDFPMLQFGVLAVAATVILANALVDIGCGLIDPRIRARAS